MGKKIAKIKETLKEVNPPTHTRQTIAWGKFKLNLCSSVMQTLNNIYFTDRRNRKISVIKNIKYAECQKCSYDIFFNKHHPLKKQPTLFYIHGGAFISNDKKHFNHFCKDFADKGYYVININYRLVPKVYISDCIADCIKAINHALETAPKIDTKNIFFAGDSAGASIAGIIASMFVDKKLTFSKKINLRALGLYYGLYDGTLMERGLIKEFLDALYEYKYVGKTLEEFYDSFNLLKRINKKFPPSLILSSESDFLKPQSLALIEKMKQLSLKMEYIIFKKGLSSIHGFNNIKTSEPYKDSLLSLYNFFEKYKKTLTIKNKKL